MKKRYKLIIGMSVFFLLGASVWGLKRADAGQDIGDNKEFIELTKNNPYTKSIVSRTASDLYAKGEHIYITKEEMKWQKKVMEIAMSDNPEEDAFKEACRFKTLSYYASAEGFSTSDEEIEQMVQELKASYEESKKDGITIPVFEEYGGVENHQNQIWELSRQKMNIQKFMEVQKDEFYNSLDEETLNNSIFNNLWEEKRKEIESELVEKEKIKKCNDHK